MTELQRTLAELKDAYCDLHTRKEDLFWITKMGIAEDPSRARREMAEAEKAWNRFVQDPGRLARLRAIEQQDAPGPEQARRALEGWIAMLSAHVVENPEARKLSEEIVELEGELERRRGEMELGLHDPATGRFERASSVKLALIMRADPDEGRRRAAFEGLRSIEPFVLENGFLQIVRKRNELARLLGYSDFYAWRVKTVEQMSKERLFGILDDLAARTRERTQAALERFTKMHGEGALEPWNFGYLRSGELSAKLDPYFGFGQALRRWMRSFHALGIHYRGASLTLDLLDRQGKYENGFMHGPEIAFFDEGNWQPARINFTANAVVGQVGAGLRATQTLFHEGGHAAHFSNILSNAPCFAQEFAPTSVAYAETQSMFLDSLLEDADWMTRYARDANGRPIPMELIEESIHERQPFQGWDVRYMLTVPFAERAIYEIPDAELGPERVVDELRRVERELQGLTSGVRPVLAVPHLLAGESSAYYHGYVMAEMAVYQTRRHFLKRDGHLCDNPKVGADVAREYWAPGNAIPFDDTLRNLTGSPLSADALVDECNLSVDDAIEAARAQVQRLSEVPEPEGPIDLEGHIHVVHGRDIVASTDEQGYEGACDRFESWIREQEQAKKS